MIASLLLIFRWFTAQFSRVVMFVAIIGLLVFAQLPSNVVQSSVQPPIPLPYEGMQAKWMTAAQANLAPEARVEPQVTTRGNGIIDECDNTVGNLYCMRQNASLDDDNNNSVVCILEGIIAGNTVRRMAETRYYRLFDLADYENDPEAQLNAAFVVSSIGVGIEVSEPSDGNNRQPIYINLYQTDLTRAQLENNLVNIEKNNTTMIASYRYEKLATPHDRGGIYEGITSSDDGKVVYFPFHAKIEANQRFLIEVIAPTSELVVKDGVTSDGHLLYIGTNTAGQNLPNPAVDYKSFIASPACGISEPTVVDDVGMAHVRTIIFPVGVYEQHFSELAPNPFAVNPGFEGNVLDWCVPCSGIEASWLFPKNGAYEGQGFIRFDGITGDNPDRTIIRPNIEPINFPLVASPGLEYVGLSFFASVKKGDLTNLRVRTKFGTPEQTVSVTVKTPTCFSFPLPAFNAPPPTEGQCPSDVIHWQGFTYWSTYLDTISQVDQLQIRYKDSVGRIKFDLMSLLWVRLGDV